MSLLELINNDKTDKNTVHSYLETYERLFHTKKETAKNILEIGILGGGSIKLWHDYFKNATIYGLDIIKSNQIWSEIKNKPRINLGRFDAYQPDFFNNQLLKQNLKFDILIDDGPHTLESMIFFIKNYSKLMETNGILVVEDVATIDWIQALKDSVPDELKDFIEVYDLRENKNRFDDILFVINKEKLGF
jgi:hypothetical protein